MLQRLSCPWCDDDESRGVYFLKILSSKMVFSVGVWKLLISEKEDIEDICFFCHKYNMKAILLFFTIQVRTSSDIISGECLSIGLVSSQHFAGGKDPPRRKQIQNLWKKNSCHEQIHGKFSRNIATGKFFDFQVWSKRLKLKHPPTTKQIVLSLWRAVSGGKSQGLLWERQPAIAEMWCTCLTTLWTNKSSSQARHSMCNMGAFYNWNPRIGLPLAAALI